MTDGYRDLGSPSGIGFAETGDGSTCGQVFGGRVVVRELWQLSPDEGSPRADPTRRVWIRVDGWVGWKRFLGAITLGPATRLLYGDMSSDMVMSSALAEVLYDPAETPVPNS